MYQSWANSSPSDSTSCLVIGAGLAGLTAAGILQRAGLRTRVLEANAVPGGRLATLIDDEAGSKPAAFDHGAQFFTVREEPFAALVKSWLEAGAAIEWSRGFATADGSYYADGHPRYIGQAGMTSIAGHLADGLDIEFEQQVTQVAASEGKWQITTTSGRQYTAQTLILTPPVPQSLALLEAGSVRLPDPIRQSLAQISYEPCIAVMVQLDAPSQIPDPGGMWPLGEPLAWIADNHRKGISAAPGAVTLHAGPEFSHTYWSAPDDEVSNRLVEAAEPWLGAKVIRSHVRRWRHSKPLWTHPERYLYSVKPAPLLFAGDAFAGPRVEGAVLSGMAAAEHLLP